MAGDVQSWIASISTSISALVIASGIWLSLRDYRLKLAAEARQQQTADIDAEIRLQNQFTQLMQIAHARSSYVVSEAVVKHVLDQSSAENISPCDINRRVAEASVIALPVGSASQDAAIAAISDLTLRYRVLREPGLRALTSLSSFHPLASEYLKLARSAL